MHVLLTRDSNKYLAKDGKKQEKKAEKWKRGRGSDRTILSLL
jgi:hypothetical protein